MFLLPSPWLMINLPNNVGGSVVASAPQMEINFWLRLSAKQHWNTCWGPPPMYQDLSTWHDWPELLTKGLLICQSGWREIHNSFPVIHWVHLGPWTEGSRRFFADITNLCLFTSAKQASAVRNKSSACKYMLFDEVQLMQELSTFSRIQPVVYYQYCILIGWATTRLYVIAH